MSVEHLSDDAQIRRFRQFIRWVVPLAWGFTAFYGVAYLLAPQATLAIITVLCFTVSCVMVWSYRLIANGHFTSAVVALCMALLGSTVMSALAVPATPTMLVTGVLMAVAIMLLFTEGAVQRNLMWAAVCAIIIVVLLCELVELFPPPPATFLTILNIAGNIVIPAIIIWLLRQFAARQQATLVETSLARDALRVANDTLEAQVTSRTSALQAALGEVETRAAEQTRLLQELADQREVIRELAVPVLPVGRSTLVMPLIGVLDSERLRQAQEQALRTIEQRRARRLLLDITGVPMVDSQVAQGLLAVVTAARLLGAEVVLVGVRPEVAQAIVGVGLDLSGVKTLSDLQNALAVA